MRVLFAVQRIAMALVLSWDKAFFKTIASYELLPCYDADMEY
jgi:hypothetical protein